MTYLKQMRPIAHTIAIVSAIVTAFVWLELPFLRPFALQAFAGSVILYFGLKWLHKRNPWHLAPHSMSGEMAVATFAFLMLIGATGNLNSPFYPLAYAHLFFLVFATETGTSLAVLMGLLIFHYALGVTWSPATVADLATTPLIFLFFLFARDQYQHIRQQQEQLMQEKEIIVQEERDVVGFFENVMKPQLAHLKQLVANTQAADHVNTDLQQIESQINQLEEKIYQYQEQVIAAHEDATATPEATSEQS